jgi:hypothetical protein
MHNLIYNTKLLQDHFNSDVFRWHVYHHQQGECSHQKLEHRW